MEDAAGDRDEPARTAHVRGLWRGRELAGEVALLLEDDALLLRPGGRAPVAIAWDALDGVGHDGTTLTLYLAGDDVLELAVAASEADIAGLARQLIARACRMGEQTLPLRGLGSHRAFPGEAQDRYWAPLLEARRALERAPDTHAQLAAFDTEALGRAVRDTIGAFAAERFPQAPAERRALEAALLDDVAPLLAALERLEDARDETLIAPDDSRLARWRAWSAGVGALFAQADRAWLAMLPSLAGTPPPRRGFWGRLFGRGT